MAKGGHREGAGRKSKAEELGLPKLIEEVIGDEGKRLLIQKVYANAVPKRGRGSFKHQELLMYYIYGRPTEKVKVEATGSIKHTITGMIVK
jgi:hypothetical protein